MRSRPAGATRRRWTRLCQGALQAAVVGGGATSMGGSKVPAVTDRGAALLGPRGSER